MKRILIIILIIAALVGAYAYLRGDNSAEPVDQSTTQNRYMDIESYVRTYISELSPVPEVLGGRFYVTDIETGDGRGTVSYEDGHNAYVADFEYEIEDSGAVKIESFEVRK